MQIVFTELLWSIWKLIVSRNMSIAYPVSSSANFVANFMIDSLLDERGRAESSREEKVKYLL